jgi:GT2 family glycosyltransferase/glycosyltransferase involved in cell wall biosynthesis
MPEPSNQDRTPALVITGMHRSGTSLVASLCQAGGLDIGSRLLGSYPGNEPGHFEDLEFVNWHETVLRANGFGTEGFLATSIPHVPHGLRRDAEAIVSVRRGNATPWGWKDPRTTLHLDFWAELLPEARFLFVIRRPWEVVDSLFRRGDETFRMNPPLAVQVWLHFNRLIRDFIARHASRCLVCDVTQAIEGPAEVFGAIREWLGIPLADPPPLYQHAMLTRLDDAGRIALVAAACPEAIALYDDLMVLAGSRPATMPAQRENALADVGFHDWSLARGFEGRRRSLEHALREARESATSAEAQLQESRNHAASAENALRESRNTAARLETQLGESRDAATRLEAHLRGSRHAVTRLKNAIRESQAAREADNRSNHARLEAMEHARLALERRVAADRAHLAGLGHQARDGEQRIAQLEVLLGTARAAEAEALATRQQDERSASAERATLESRCGILETEVCELRGQLAVAEAQARDFMRATEAVREMEASNSWRLTWPLRAARRVTITAPLRLLRRQVSSLGRRVWRRLPLSIPEKQRIRETLFRRVGFLFRWTDSYREWHTHRAIPTFIPAALAPQAPSRPHDATPLATGVRVIAMHLPQFHSIAENDAWWGEGFTEWTNVRRGEPMYPGHEQPHVPHPDIGTYDLADPTVLERQAALAASYGIAGFCFYYYWFSGRRLLEKPLAEMLRSGKPDFPFCICWANENWTRTWDGHDTEVLMAQTHAPDDAEKFIRDLLPMLRDPRYIRVAGRPLIAVYRTESLPDPRRTAAIWRAICRAEGIGEIHLVAVRSFSKHDPAQDGFDAALQLPPLQIPAANLAADPGFRAAPGFAGSVHNYEEAIGFSLAEAPHDYRMYRGVMPAWDNTARRMERATSWINASPERYGAWLAAAIDRTIHEQPPEHRLVFVNAWNEWAEGAHLEPDERHGYANLEQTARALGRSVDQRPPLSRDDTTLPAQPPELRMHAWSRVCKLFGGEPRLPQYAFLADYPSLLSQVSAAGGRLRVENGRPMVCVDEATFYLDDRGSLTSPLHRLRQPDATPFCFVVLQFNRWDVTAKCLDSLRRLESRRPVRIVVVDNGSTEDVLAATREAVAAMPDVELLETGANRGFAGGNNVGYAHVRQQFGAAFVAVINNDTRIEDPAFITRCEELFDRYGYSVLGPDIVTPDGRHENPWNDVVYSPDDWRLLADMYDEDRATFERTGTAVFRRPGTRTSESRFLPNPLLQGAAIVLSPVFVASSPTLFDERTNLYGEEFLFAVGNLRAGHFIVYSSDVCILHEEGVSTGALPSEHKMRLGYENASKAARLALTEIDTFAAACRGEPLPSDSPVLPTLLASPRRHILVDLLFCQPGFHGGGEYGKAVFKALVASAAARGDVQIWAALDPALFIDGWVWETCREHAINIVAVTSFSAITQLVNTGMFTSFFAPAIVVYTGYEYQRKVGGQLGFAANGTRVVGTLLDVRDLEMAEDWERIATARRAVGCLPERAMPEHAWKQERDRQAAHARDLQTMYCGIASHPSLDALVTISDYSAASIQARVGTGRSLDVLFPPRKDRPDAERFTIPGIEPGRDEFVLVMNAGRIEKNAATAVAVFDRLCADFTFAAEHPRLKLVLVGIGSVDDLGLEAIAHRDRVITLPHLPPEHLEFLYREARCLLYPSFNEGFGYPPLEAMDHGTPSVIADNTSVPEVCGSAAVPCNPFDEASVARALVQVIHYPPDAACLAARHAAILARQKRDLAALVRLVLDGVRSGDADAPGPA